MKVFVSGAAGFIGKAVTAELSRRGHQVMGLAKSELDARIVKEAGGRPVMGNLLGSGEWCDAVQTVDKVVSLTHPISMGESISTAMMKEYNHRHTEAVTNLIKAAADGRARSVIVTYDTLCFGDRKGRWVSDADSLDPIGYCRPLTESFKAIERTALDAELPLIQVFPGRVYGNGGWFRQLIGNFLNGTAKVVEPGNNFLSLIHVEDVAVFYALAVEQLSRNESFCLADNRPVQQRVLLDHIADMMDLPSPPMVDFQTYANQFGILAAETMSSSTRVQGLKAMDLLGHIPRVRSYETGVPYALKAMGIEPRKGEMEEAA